MPSGSPTPEEVEQMKAVVAQGFSEYFDLVFGKDISGEVGFYSEVGGELQEADDPGKFNPSATKAFVVFKPSTSVNAVDAEAFGENLISQKQGIKLEEDYLDSPEGDKITVFRLPAMQIDKMFKANASMKQARKKSNAMQKTLTVDRDNTTYSAVRSKREGKGEQQR